VTPVPTTNECWSFSETVSNQQFSNDGAEAVVAYLHKDCTVLTVPVKHYRPGAISLGIDGSKTGEGFEGPSEQGRRRVSRGILICL